MENFIDYITIAISLLALLTAIISAQKSAMLTKQLANEETRLNKAIFHFNRNVEYEGKLGEWPDAMAIHGIDLNAAGNDGVKDTQIAYLIQSVNAMVALCDSNGITIEDHINSNDYRQNIFKQEITQKVWKYSRKVISEAYRKPIDEFIANNKVV